MSTLQQRSDEELIELWRAGQQRAFEVLVGRYLTKVYDLCFRMLRSTTEAEDATQETFAAICGNIASFRYESSFSTWLYRVATNKVLDMIRKRNTRARYILPVDEPEEAAVGYEEGMSRNRGDPEATLVQQHEAETLWTFVDELAPNYRIVLLLFYREELTYDEIAEVLGVPKRTVETRLYRARRQLRQKWMEAHEVVDG